MSKKSKKQILISSLFSIVVIMLLILTAVLMIGKFKGEITFIAGKSVLWVLTPSMEDTIPEQSYILIQKASAEDIRVGDVITFVSSDPKIQGQLNTHRVTQIIGDNEEFVTKGDNNLVEDEYHVLASNVKAKYVRNLPVLSALGRLLSKKIGLALILALFLVAICGIYLPEFLRTVKEVKNDSASCQSSMDEADFNERVRLEVERLKEADMKQEVPPSAEATPLEDEHHPQ